MYKPNAFALKWINCECRISGISELTRANTVDIKFFNKNIPGLGMYPMANILKDGVKIAECNSRFAETQFKSLR
jgi:hypothetical protein